MGRANEVGLKFYRTKGGPTVILNRCWADEADEIDGLLKQECGSDARWQRLFAVDDVADLIYALYKKGRRSLTFNAIRFVHDYRNVWKVMIEDKEDIELERYPEPF